MQPQKSNELIAHTYSHLLNYLQLVLDFTVYGPWEADMALYKFTDLMMKNKPIKVFNYDMIRDFTYIDDVIESIYCLIDKLPIKEEKSDEKVLILQIAGHLINFNVEILNQQI